MSIRDRIDSIALHIENAYIKVEDKSGTIPTYKNLENLANAIDSIPATSTAQLNAPSLSLGTPTSTSDPLIITNTYNGNFVQYYDVYESNNLLTTISANLTSNTINLRDYISTPGDYTIRVIAKGSNFQNSSAATIAYRYGSYVIITKNIVHGSIEDDAKQLTVIGDSYRAILTEDVGYSWVGASVSIYMDGIDVTSSVYDGKRNITIASITGDITINVTFAPITTLSAPTIVLSGNSLQISSVTNAEYYDLYLNGNYWRRFDITTIDVSTYLVLDGIYNITAKAGADGYATSNSSNQVTYTNSSGLVPDATLNNNSWAVIALTCQLGNASQYWAVGDTKVDTGTDTNTRTFRICDMQGLYNKHVVFEQVQTESDTYNWNSSSNVDLEGAENNYSISNVRANHLPTIMSRYSTNLQGVLTETTYKVAKNGKNSTILELSDKLFLPACKELLGRPAYSREEEANVLTQYQYYINVSPVKYKPNSQGANYWTRSPGSGGLTGAVVANYISGGSYGAPSHDSVIYLRNIAPFFSF